jgi:hypothetical protein
LGVAEVIFEIGVSEVGAGVKSPSEVDITAVVLNWIFVVALMNGAVAVD